MGTDDRKRKEDLKRWLRDCVAPEIDERREHDIDAPHVSADYLRGVLAWMAERFIDDDPEQLVYPDGSHDGGMDIVSTTSGEEESRYDIYQVHAPRLDQIGSGRITTITTKFAADMRRFRRVVTGKAKKYKELNRTAKDILRQINRSRELASDEEAGAPAVEIHIHSLCLKRAGADAKLEIDELMTEAKEQWSNARERWVVHPILDLGDLFDLYHRQQPKGLSPEKLDLELVGTLSKDHAKRGPFLGFVKAIGVIEAYRKYGSGLLDSNLRFALGKTEVNKRLEEELAHVRNVKWFHEKNNGLVLTCNNCSATGEKLKLAAPQIINGGQTIHTLTKVLDELESIPSDKSSPEQKELRKGMRENLILGLRIVTISGASLHRPEEIALASNTQNKLSERTLFSSRIQMLDLRLLMSRSETPWYVVTKDGEWEAVRKKKRLLQSKTRNRNLSDFAFEKRKYRRVENRDLGVASLAFCGFLGEAKPSRIFKEQNFRHIFGYRPKDESWRHLAGKTTKWKSERFDELFENESLGPSQWILAYLVWQYWREFTLPESKQILRAYYEMGEKDPSFKERHLKSSGWDVPEELQRDLINETESVYWTEQVAKSAYLVLVYQTMRILVKAFGNLDEEACSKILGLAQFAELHQGQSVSSIGDFRDGSLSDGPLTAIARIMYFSCRLLWERYESHIRPMTSRQQILLGSDWVVRFGDTVDKVCSRIDDADYRTAHDLEGPGDATLKIKGIEDLLKEGGQTATES